LAQFPSESRLAGALRGVVFAYNRALDPHTDVGGGRLASLSQTIFGAGIRERSGRAIRCNAIRRAGAVLGGIVSTMRASDEARSNRPSGLMASTDRSPHLLEVEPWSPSNLPQSLPP